VAAFTGMSGCSKTEWVAALAWIGWSLWAGIRRLEPYEYLSQVLKALPYADTVEIIEALLPWNIKNPNSAG